MSRQQDYIDRLPMMLLVCQELEEALKMYIWRADVMIHLAVKERIYYRGFGNRRLFKLPLGGLIEEFERRSSRDDLVRTLKELQTDRNFFAHQGFLVTYEPDKREVEAEQLLSRLEAAIPKANECLKEIIKAISAMTGEKLPAGIDELGEPVATDNPDSARMNSGSFSQSEGTQRGV